MSLIPWNISTALLILSIYSYKFLGVLFWVSWLISPYTFLFFRFEYFKLVKNILANCIFNFVRFTIVSFMRFTIFFILKIWQVSIVIIRVDLNIRPTILRKWLFRRTELLTWKLGPFQLFLRIFTLMNQPIIFIIMRIPFEHIVV